MQESRVEKLRRIRLSWIISPLKHQRRLGSNPGISQLLLCESGLQGWIGQGSSVDVCRTEGHSETSPSFRESLRGIPSNGLQSVSVSVSVSNTFSLQGKAPRGHRSEGGMIRLETLTELKLINSNFSSLSSYLN